MHTAAIVADGLGGWAGPATLYRLDWPINGMDHLLVFHQPPMYGQYGQLVVFLSDENARVKDTRPLPGSGPTNEPNHHLALAQVGDGYRIAEPEPELLPDVEEE